MFSTKGGFKTTNILKVYSKLFHQNNLAQETGFAHIIQHGFEKTQSNAVLSIELLCCNWMCEHHHLRPA